jgi:UPF0489 domain
MTIPLVIVEEHHEAFYVWNYAFRRGWIQRSRNTLLHVDHHSDMEIPNLSRPLSSIRDDHDLARFTYDELNIASFVLAGARQRVYNRILWMKADHPRPGMTIPMQLIGGQTLPAEGGILAVDFIHQSPTLPIPADQPVLLDIDLDYFCCNEHPAGVHEIEVSRSAHEDFVSNPYHFLKLPPSNRAEAARREGRYFLRFNARHPESDHPNAAAQIAKRIAGLMEALRASSISPQLIVLCRSVHSGYTPVRHARLIEESLIEAFQQVYPLRTSYIGDLLPPSIIEFSGMKEVFA